MEFISHSQHADDYIAWQLLGKKFDGIVVEVGAFDGVHLSNSFSLAKLGWESVCVEPNPVIYPHLCKNRPNTVNVNAAVVSDPNIEEIQFYREEIGVLSGCAYDEEDVKARYKKRGLDYKEPEKLTVPAKTLSSILLESGLQNKVIDIVSIDVEGFEMEVLKGLNFNDFEVNLFIIEANDDNYRQLILDYFKDHNSYLHVGDNHQNLFLVRKSSISKRNLRSLDFDAFIRARQYHPIDESLVKHSIKPFFKKSPEALAYEKAWWKIW